MGAELRFFALMAHFRLAKKMVRVVKTVVAGATVALEQAAVELVVAKAAAYFL